MKVKLLFVFFVLLLTISIYSAPLKFFPVTLKQPDGSLLKCFASGDEFHNWYHDKENFTIMQHPETGYYVYAVKNGEELSASEYVAGKSNPKMLGIEPGINISRREYITKKNNLLTAGRVVATSRAPKTGTFTNLVVFTRFSDDPEFNEPFNKFNEMYNANNSNSVYSFFYEASYQKLQMVSHLYPSSATNIISYQDSHPRAYYQPFNSALNPIGYTDLGAMLSRGDNLVKAAALYIKNSLPPGLDLDGDNDGYIDNFTLLLQGDPGAWGDFIWPHMRGISIDVTLNGSQFNLMNLGLQNAVGPGVVCHELFHSIGAPDLYHYNDNGLWPVGIWDLMDGTEWSRPQHMNMYMKYKYGKWIDVLPEITSSGTYSLNPNTSHSNNIYKIKSPNSTNEFFILEYRKKEGLFDINLPGSGLLIYRVNNTRTGNADGPPDEMYL